MKLSNPLKSLTWNSLFRSSRNRLRRRLPTFAPMSLAAEVLEERVLLQGGTGTVNVQQVGTALVVTADANGTAGTSPVVTIYRLNATTVEVDGGGSTLIAKNGAFGSAASSQTFAISSLSGVSGITVNLGTGYDEFYIKDLSVGLGGITFIGKSGGGTGDDLEVYNDSSTAMTIGGGITIRGNTVGSALAHSGSVESDFRLYTNSTGDLTVGSVSASQSNSGSPQQKNQLYTHGAGNLKILGAVTLTLTQTGAGYQQNDIYTDSGSGSISIGLGVKESATGGTNESDNYVVTNFAGHGATGNITIGLGLTEIASAAYSGQNYVYNGYTTSGNISIGLGVTMTATQSNAGGINQADNFIFTSPGSGGIQIGGSVTMNNTGMSLHFNWIHAESGAITIGLGVTINDSGSTNYSQNEIFTDGTGNIKVGLGVTINSTAASTASGNENKVYSGGSGSVAVGGLITIKTNETGSSSYYTEDYVFSSGAGTLSALGVAITDSGSQAMYNEIFNSAGGAVTIGLLGVTVHGSGSGYHDTAIYVYTGTGSVTIAGSVIVTDSTTGSGNQLLEVEGSVYIGGALLVTMNGTDAEIDINEDSGLGTVEIRGLFHATMLGTGALIIAGDSGDSGSSLVLFDLGVSLLGSSGAGARFEKEPGVTALFVLPVFFSTPST